MKISLFNGKKQVSYYIHVTLHDGCLMLEFQTSFRLPPLSLRHYPFSPHPLQCFVPALRVDALFGRIPAGEDLLDDLGIGRLLSVEDEIVPGSVKGRYDLGLLGSGIL